MVERPFHHMSQGTQSIDRAAQVLVHVLETADPPTVGALSARLELPKSTTSRLVGALERQGLIQRDGGGAHLVPGAVLQRYARRETGDAELVDLAAEALDRLAQASGETVNVGVPSLGAVELLDQRDSRHFLGSTNWVGRRVPAHGSALGKVFYAFGALPVPSGPLEPLAPRTSAPPTPWGSTRCGPAATRPPSRSSSRASGPSPPPCATRRAPSSPRSASPARPCGSGRGLLQRFGRLLVAEARDVSALLGHHDRKRGVA